MQVQATLPFPGGLPAPHERPKQRRITFAALVELVVQECGIPFADLEGPCRARRIARPRQALMYLACQDTDRSTPWIGCRLGGRDHTTVLHGRDRIKRILETDDETEEIRLRIRSIERNYLVSA
jgi:chromosomal replication initiator protein